MFSRYQKVKIYQNIVYYNVQYLFSTDFFRSLEKSLPSARSLTVKSAKALLIFDYSFFYLNFSWFHCHYSGCHFTGINKQCGLYVKNKLRARSKLAFLLPQKIRLSILVVLMVDKKSNRLTLNLFFILFEHLISNFLTFITSFFNHLRTKEIWLNKWYKLNMRGSWLLLLFFLNPRVFLFNFQQLFLFSKWSKQKLLARSFCWSFCCC